METVALVFIFILVIGFAAQIVVLGSLPKKIALKRNHPHPDAVNAASWIGLATGVLWPFAFVWAFLPIPRPVRAATEGGADTDTSLQKRIDELEALVAKLQSGSEGSAS
jgi:hypothetical protein